MIAMKSHHTSLMLDKIFTSFLNPSSRELGGRGMIFFAAAIADNKIELM